MEIHNSDVILLLKLRDKDGLPMRVEDCSRFKLRVWTQTPACHLVYHKRDIITDGHIDRISIPARDMKTLQSGVICYSYSWAKPSEDFASTDHLYDCSQVVVTEIYWRNTNFHEMPNNPVNFESLEHLKDLIEDESRLREEQIAEFQRYLDEDFTNGLADEIERSTAKDTEHDEAIAANTEAIEAEVNRAKEAEAEILALIGAQEGDVTTVTDGITARLDAEITRATAKDNEHDTALTNEAIRAQNEEGRIELKIDNETSRAKAAEASVESAISAEATRAQSAEATLQSAIAAANAQVTANATAIANEVTRSTAKDTEHTSAINDEVSRAQTAEQRIEAKADAAANRLTSLEADVAENTDNIADEISRSTAKDNELATAITTEVNRAKAEEARIEGLITSSSTDLTALTSQVNANTAAINNEVSRAKGEEGRIEGKADDAAAAVTTESNRAKAVESDITTQLTTLKTSYLATKAIAEANQTALVTVNGDETVIGSIAHAVKDCKHYTDDAVAAAKAEIEGAVGADLSTLATKAEVNQAVADLVNGAPSTLDTLKEIADALNDNSDAIDAINAVAGTKANAADVYTKAEIDSKVTAINSSVSAESTRAQSEEARIENLIGNGNTNLAAEVSRATAAEQSIEAKADANTAEIAAIKTDVNGVKASVTTEVSRAKGEEGRIETKVDTLDGKVSGEIARATAAEQSIDAKADANTAEIAAIKTNLATASNDVTAEVSRATAEEARIEGKADAAAQSIAAEVSRAQGIEGDLTTQLQTLKTSYLATKAIAEANQTALVTVNGDASVIGSIAHSLEDAKHYTDDAIANANANAAADAKHYTDEKIAQLINGAPSTLDTLKEIADALGDNGDVVNALTTAIGQKADKTDVYTKAEVNAKETALNASIAAEQTRATAAENAVSTIANQANDMAAQSLTTANANAAALTTANTTIAAHTAALEVINGDETVIGSIAHAVKDCKHYTDDKIADIEGEIPTKVSELENDLAFVKTPDNSVVKDANNNIVNELVIDATGLDPEVEIYTRAQCDAKFALKGSAVGNVDLSDYVQKDGAKVLSTNDYTNAEKAKLAAMPNFWSGTQAEYDAIATKDDNTIYLVK